MTEDQAITIVEEQRESLGIDSEMEFFSAEKAIVEYKENPRMPGSTTDRVAWVVTFCFEGQMAEVHVDDKTGTILSILRDG